MEYTAKNCFRMGMALCFLTSLLGTFLFNFAILSRPTLAGDGMGSDLFWPSQSGEIDENTDLISLDNALSITSIAPSSTIVNNPISITVTITGAGFEIGNVVWFNGHAVQSEFVSATVLRATIPASDFTASGIFDLKCAQSQENVDGPTAQFTVGNPVPILTGISPAAVVVGSSGTLSVFGSGFLNSSTSSGTGSVVRVNGTDRTTTFVSSTELRIEITTTDTSNAGVKQITIFNPTPGGGISLGQGGNAGTVPLTIVAQNQQGPIITSVSPTGTLVYAAATIVITGSGFIGFNSVVYFNNTPIAGANTLINATGTQIAVSVPQSVAAGGVTQGFMIPGLVAVVVKNNNGTQISNTGSFQIWPIPQPFITRIDPTNHTPGGFSLSVYGGGFYNINANLRSRVKVNGVVFGTTFVSSTELSISPTWSVGQKIIRVYNPVLTPQGGGGESNAEILTVAP